MKEISGKHTLLSDMESFSSGYIIVGSTLFYADKGHVDAIEELSGKTVEEKVIESRQIEDLTNRKRIVYDDLEYFSEDVLCDTGKLQTADQAFDELSDEEKEGWESLAEYYNKD